MGDEEGPGGLMKLFIVGEVLSDDCRTHSGGGFAFYNGDEYNLKREAAWEDFELTIPLFFELYVTLRMVRSSWRPVSLLENMREKMEEGALSFPWMLSLKCLTPMK